MTIDQLKKEKNELNGRVQSTSKTVVDHVSSRKEPVPNGFETFTRTQSKKDITMTGMNHEVLQLRDKVDKLEEKLDGEEDLAHKANALAQEYKVQVQELRQLITDERFAQKGSSENVNPYPTL